MGIAGESGDAVIRIRVLRVDPLTGIAVSEDGAELGFEGWMELIGAVANLIGSPDLPPDPGPGGHEHVLEAESRPVSRSRARSERAMRYELPDQLATDPSYVQRDPGRRRALA
jgi:hypothetical protein